MNEGVHGNNETSSNEHNVTIAQWRALGLKVISLNIDSFDRFNDSMTHEWQDERESAKEVRVLDCMGCGIRALCLVA